ncbi:hypothetical protein F4823DRAFT_324555 [Ustulina deusta]|nr:hypothetical protein F4823DRAFT_324555 [Ustulina deusta]
MLSKLQLADLRRAHHLPATSVAYGIWEGDGMATGLTGRTTLNHLDKFGLGQPKPAEGLKLFERAVSSDCSLAVVVALNLERLQQYFVGEEGEDGGIPPFYRNLSQQQANGKRSRSNKAQNGTRNQSLQEAFARAEPAQHAEIVLRMVRETVAKALGFMSADEVDTAVSARTATALDAMAIGQGCLDPAFSFSNIAEVPSPRSVFITGATGFVAAFILHQVLERGVTTYCLIRAKDIEHGRERLISALDNYDLW